MSNFIYMKNKQIDLVRKVYEKISTHLVLKDWLNNNEISFGGYYTSLNDWIKVIEQAYTEVYNNYVSGMKKEEYKRYCETYADRLDSVLFSMKEIDFMFEPGLEFDKINSIFSYNEVLEDVFRAIEKDKPLNRSEIIKFLYFSLGALIKRIQNQQFIVGKNVVDIPFNSNNFNNEITLESLWVESKGVKYEAFKAYVDNKIIDYKYFFGKKINGQIEEGTTLVGTYFQALIATCIKLGYIDNMNKKNLGLKSKAYSGQELIDILYRSFPGEYTEKYYSSSPLNAIMEKGNKYTIHFKNLEKDILEKKYKM